MQEKPITVLVGYSKSTHYRLYTEDGLSTEQRKEQMIFDGMDGVVINTRRTTSVSGCWEDIEAQPKLIEELVGPKGLAFIALLNKQRVQIRHITTPVRGRKKKVKILFDELVVVSAWQFSLKKNGSPIVPPEQVMMALEKHLGAKVRPQKWVLK